MIDISLTYYPGKWHRLLYLFKRSIFKGYAPIEYQRKAPEKWDELTEKDILAISRANFMLGDKEVKKIYLACHFLNLPFFIFKKMSLSDVNHVYEHINTLLDENTLAKTLVKEFHIRGADFIGPADYGANICFLEFIKADSYYGQFTKSKNLDFLNLLVATLYRPLRDDLDEEHIAFNGDMRTPFNEFHIKERAKKMKRVQLAHRYAILLQYAGLRQWIQNKYPETFRERKSSKFGWSGVIVSLAGEKFGDDDAVANKNIHAIFTHLEMSSIEADKYNSK
jgi:hypothetical protein